MTTEKIDLYKKCILFSYKFYFINKNIVFTYNCLSKINLQVCMLSNQVANKTFSLQEMLSYFSPSEPEPLHKLVLSCISKLVSFLNFIFMFCLFIYV